MPALNNQLAKFLKIEQLALSSWCKPTLAYRWWAVCMCVCVSCFREKVESLWDSCRV